MYKSALIGSLLLIIGIAAPANAARDIHQTSRAMPFGSPENLFEVVLETSKGDVVLEVHPEWSPIGAAHFRELVEAGYYDGAPWFRVIEDFVAQCGIAADPEMTAQWQDLNIPDERVVQGNTRGYVSYGKSAEPDSRSTHIFINFDNNSRLDAVGFSAFAVVVEGMDVVDSFFITAENPPDTQEKLTEQGVSFFRQLYPEGDYIVHAFVREARPEPCGGCSKTKH